MADTIRQTITTSHAAIAVETEAMAGHYSKEADLSRTMDIVAETFQREVNSRGTMAVKPEGK